MRHKRAGLHLSRTAAHRKALFSNMVAALFTYDHIRTTEVKAKEIRRLAERTITWAIRLGPVLTKKAEKRTAEEKQQVLHAVQMASRMVRDRDAIMKLFNEIAPRYLTRHGGYTRITKLQQRPGDAAPMALLELIPSESAKEEAKPEGTAKKKATKKEGASKEPATKAKASKAKDSEPAKKKPAAKKTAKKEAKE
jgi:large subunit ribosomal protein L17